MAVRPPLPRPPDTFPVDKSGPTGPRHPTTLVHSRGDNPKDKSGLLDVKKGMDVFSVEYFALIGVLRR